MNSHKRAGADSLAGTSYEKFKLKSKTKDTLSFIYLVFCYCIIRLQGYSHAVALWAIGKGGQHV